MQQFTQAHASATPLPLAGRWPGMPGMTEDDDTSNDKPYPQLNLNTGVSVAVVIMVAGGIYWNASLKGDVGYHEQRLTIVEAGLRDVRIAQGQSDTKLEGRLTRIEILLQDVLNRMADRREGRPN